MIRCLDTRLKTAVLERYRGIEYQINFVAFFVLNERLLELMTLGIRTRNNNEEFLAEHHKKLQLVNMVFSDASFYFATYRFVGNYWCINYFHELDLTDPFAHI